MTVSGTPGTGTITLGSAILDATNGDCLTFSNAGVQTGQIVPYIAVDGHNFGYGQGTYTSAGTTLTRDAAEVTWNGTAVGSTPISLSSATIVGISPRGVDLSPQLFQEVITTGSQASVTFSGIPATFRDLEIRVRGRSDAAATNIKVMAQFNADTGANYQYQINQSYSSGTLFAQTPNATSAALGEITGATATASYVGMIKATVGNYRATTGFKQGLSVWGNTIGTGTFSIGAGNNGFAWSSASAIISVKVFPLAGNFVDNSIISLYLVN